jgi:hypothetical protein
MVDNLSCKRGSERVAVAEDLQGVGVLALVDVDGGDLLRIPMLSDTAQHLRAQLRPLRARKLLQPFVFL